MVGEAVHPGLSRVLASRKRKRCLRARVQQELEQLGGKAGGKRGGYRMGVQQDLEQLGGNAVLEGGPRGGHRPGIQQELELVVGETVHPGLSCVLASRKRK